MLDSMTPAPTRSLTVGLLLAMTLDAVHGLAVVTALPVVADALDGHALYGAALSVFLLASLVGLAAAGRDSDRHGLARPFRSGLLLFGVGIAGSAAAPSMSFFVAARAVEGLGGGMLTAVLYATVNRAYPEAERPRMLAWLSAAWVVPGILAPPLAGAVAETWGWRPVFWGLLPGVAVCAVLALPALFSLSASPRRTDASGAGDGVGSPGVGVLRDALRLATGAGLLLASTNTGAPGGFIALAGVAAVALALPALKRLLPEGTLLARRGLPAAIATKTLFAFAFFAADSFLPLAVTQVHQRSVAFAGLVLTVGALSWTAGAFLQARYASRIGSGVQTAVGAGLLFTGLVLTMGALTPAAPLAVVFVGWTVAGLGMGIGYNTANAAAMSATRAGREGATSTALGMADAIGVSAATGIGGAVLAAGLRAGVDTGDSLSGLWLLALASVFAIVLAGARLDVSGSRVPARSPGVSASKRAVKQDPA